MKYSTIYPITAANINADYRLTVDALLNFHESTVARYFTTLGVAARGNSCWSLISMSERKLVSCEGYIPASEVVNELAAGPHKKRLPLKLQDEPSSTLGHTINLIDLDFNGHTNNRRYVSMALICFEGRFLSAHRPDSLNIKFIKESRMGDEIANYTYDTDHPSTFVGKIMNGHGEELCRVVSHWRDKEPLEDISRVNLIRNP